MSDILSEEQIGLFKDQFDMYDAGKIITALVRLGRDLINTPESMSISGIVV